MTNTNTAMEKVTMTTFTNSLGTQDRLDLWKISKQAIEDKLNASVLEGEEVVKLLDMKKRAETDWRPMDLSKDLGIDVLAFVIDSVEKAGFLVKTETGTKRVIELRF